jgi:hypothetical protein
MEKSNVDQQQIVQTYLAKVLGQSEEKVFEMMEVSSSNIDYNSFGNFLLASDIIA